MNILITLFNDMPHSAEKILLIVTYQIDQRGIGGISGLAVGTASLLGSFH